MYKPRNSVLSWPLNSEFIKTPPALIELTILESKAKSQQKITILFSTLNLNMSLKLMV